MGADLENANRTARSCVGEDARSAVDNAMMILLSGSSCFCAASMQLIAMVSRIQTYEPITGRIYSLGGEQFAQMLTTTESMVRTVAGIIMILIA